jgi:hypothetical protein
MSQHYRKIVKKLLENYKDNSKRLQQLIELHFRLKNKLHYLAKNWDSKKAAFRIALAKDYPSSLNENRD